jgi:hypothetical protein
LIIDFKSILYLASHFLYQNILRMTTHIAGSPAPLIRAWKENQYISLMSQ